MNNHAANLFNKVVEGVGNDINVMMVGQIKSYDSTTNMAEVIPLHTVPKQNIEYKPLISVPVGFFNIGGFSIKVQPKVDDKLLILFCDYDIENLLINGTKQNKTTRTHALDDAIVLPLNINFLNNVTNITQDLTIAKDGTAAYVKITNSGDIILNGNSIKLGENASTKVLVEGGTYGVASSKVYAE